MPHEGSWRLRYREAIGFNHRLIACLADSAAPAAGTPLPESGNYLKLEPSNLIVTAMKKSEGSDFITIRLYEAEGTACTGRVHLSKSIREAWKTNLIEENEEAIKPREDGGLELAIKPWEIVTIKVAV
jgi:alpha-mannosidase